MHYGFCRLCTRPRNGIAERENCSVNQLINLALAEKIAVLDANYWNERKKAAANRSKTDVLKRLAGDDPPRESDELPPGLKAVKLSGKRKTSSYMRAIP